MGAPFEVETVSASDGLAAELSEFQIDLGEGPCWDAYVTQSTVVVPDISDTAHSRWPLFLNAIATLDVHAFYSFPLTIGAVNIGAVDLYSEAPDVLSAEQLTNALALARVTALDVLRYALEHRDDDAEDDGPHSRREVHQATGMVIAQMGVSATDALLLIRANAFASGRTVRETAAEITGRRITFEP
ncbi:GAF and ANTAR domain-containing protein [Herbiconiux sp. CPCC 203386]|uniref:GAF and ANTAR domain-containing protein n=1 Tax=Herbiconiux daphne TaxID=2970914 RepID=A0ABT2GWZ7_9MICO|nr:GAF and ANTAR domain-containing protein [Herbiconiux daphne]MCS5732472.1 GAF and ANTAR domain-containing protein [Herbiconiux daphne]